MEHTKYTAVRTKVYMQQNHSACTDEALGRVYRWGPWPRVQTRPLHAFTLATLARTIRVYLRPWPRTIRMYLRPQKARAQPTPWPVSGSWTSILQKVLKFGSHCGRTGPTTTLHGHKWCTQMISRWAKMGKFRIILSPFSVGLQRISNHFAYLPLKKGSSILGPITGRIHRNGL